MHYLVTQRRNEIGVRMALGARSGDVVGMVLRQGLKLAGLGVGLGALAALGATRLLSNQMYEVGANDPVTFVIAPVALLLVASVACWMPARRAAQMDPLAALRHE